MAAPAAPPAADHGRRARDERDGFGAPGEDTPVAVATARRRAAPADLVPEQVIYGRHVQRGDALRTLLIDGRLVQFTPTEYRLVMSILERGGVPVPYARLSEAALGREPDRDARRLLDKHVDHMRAKLRTVGLTVGCIARYGYVLIPDELIED
jgi:DNA-binding response OmpR family regulator